MEEGDLTEVADVGVRSDSKICNRGGQRNGMANNWYTGKEGGLGWMWGADQDGFGFVAV